VHPAAAIWRSPGRQLLVLAGLTGFAISQPLLSVLGDEPTILARHGIEGRELVALAVVIALVPPLVLWGVTRATAALGRKLDRGAHLAAVGALVGLFTVQVAKAAGLHGLLALLLAIVVAAVFVVGYVRSPPVATWASYTAILPVLAMGTFVFASPSSALLTSAAAPERVEGSGELPSVVLIVVDELPTRSVLDEEDGIDRQRFPNLARFGDDATWYRHSTTVATLTEAAVPSMLTGTDPVAEKAIWTNHPDNLFTLLAPTHELEVLEQATELCPYDICVPTAAADADSGDDEPVPEIDVGPGFGDLLGVTRDLWLERVSLGDDEPAGFDDFVEEVSETTATTIPEEEVDETSPSVTVPQERPNGDPAAALTSERAAALIASFDETKGPALYYLHLILPHQPFNRYPDGTKYEVVDPLGMGLPDEDSRTLFSWSPWTSAVSEQQHLLQAQYTDQVVGQVLDGLQDAGLYDESLVIVASDHGISFESDTAGRYVQPSTVDAIAYAPLLVKRPGQAEGAVDDANVSTIDVLPTIADELGIDVPWEVDGAPIGSDAVAGRGSAKQIADMIGFGGYRIRGTIDFDDREAFTTVGDRFIGPLPDPDDPLSGLHERLGLADLIGRRLDDVVTGREGGEVGLHDYSGLREPGPMPLGMVTGDVSADDAGGGATLILAVDGVVIGGSELSTDSDGRAGRIAVLLPQGVLDADNEIRAALVRGDGDAREVLELEVGSL
jgi:hypothetical protein